MKTFVFDADGVVCIGKRFSDALESEYDIPSHRLQPFFLGEFRECIVGLRDLKEELTTRISSWGWPGSVDGFLEFWFRREHVICSDAIASVRTLRKRGHICVLATNQEQYRAAYLRREMKMEEEFDHVFVSCELGHAKPTANFYTMIQAQLRCSPSSIFLIDDTEANVVAAKAVGWNAVHYRGPHDLPKVPE